MCCPGSRPLIRQTKPRSSPKCVGSSGDLRLPQSLEELRSRIYMNRNIGLKDEHLTTLEDIRSGTDSLDIITSNYFMNHGDE